MIWKENFNQEIKTKSLNNCIKKIKSNWFDRII